MVGQFLTARQFRDIGNSHRAANTYEFIGARIAALAKVELRIFVHDLRIADPTPLVELMSHGTVNRFVFLLQVAFGRNSVTKKPSGDPDVLTIGPPAKIIGLLDILVGTLEEGDVLLHPCGGLVVVDHGDRSVGWQIFSSVVRTLAVEGGHMAAQRVGLQDHSSTLRK